MNPEDNFMLIEGIALHLKITNSLKSLTFCGVRLAKDALKLISHEITDNKIIKELGFNYCFLDSSYLEDLMPGLCKNKNIERLNFSCNGLDDRSAHLITKIINVQCERRDEIVWSYSLRGELPPDKEYKQGLKEMALSHNNFS